MTDVLLGHVLLSGSISENALPPNCIGAIPSESEYSLLFGNCRPALMVYTLG